MRDRDPAVPRASARSWIGTVLLSAAFLYCTRDMAVPVGVIYAVVVIAAWLICRAQHARADAQHDAGVQQRRADLLARTNRSPAVTEPLHTGPRDQLVGHADRERVIERLGERYATGHLTAGDFEARATEAGQARTRGELAHTLRDLP